jgi:hypothetical protein
MTESSAESGYLRPGQVPFGCTSARGGSHPRGPDASVAPGEMGTDFQQCAPDSTLERREQGHAIYCLIKPFLPCFPHASAIP